MEYDNDRIVKGTYKEELYCWIVFAFINPLVNILGIFPYQKIAWVVLPVIALLLLPLYMLYSRLIVIKFLFKKKYLIFGLLTVLFYFLMLGLLFPLHKIAQSIVMGPGQYYFSFSNTSIIRETAWIIINILLTIALSWYRKKLDEEETMEELQKENTYYKLRYFRTQLNPHFLFNTLNSIYSLSLSKNEKTPEVVIRLSDIMRFLIYECNEEKIPLDKEIEFIRNYIEIERIQI